MIASVLDRSDYRDYDGRLRLDFDPALGPGAISFAELGQLARALRTLLGSARPLTASDLALPGEELEPRVQLRATRQRVAAYRQGFEQRVTRLEALLPGPGDDDPRPVGDAPLGQVRNRMRQLAGWGPHAAVPSTGWSEANRATLFAEAWSLATRARGRLDALSALEARWARDRGGTPPSAETRLERAHERFVTLMGRDVPLLPTFGLAAPQATAALFSGTETLTGGDAGAVTGWLRKLAKVQPGVAELDEVLTLSELLQDQATLHPSVAQIPTQDSWVALHPPSDPERGSLALCTFDHGGLAALAAGAPISGLVLDSWTERVPAEEVVTGVALHFDAPSSRPPQSLVLVVPPEGESWDFTLVVDSLLEALEAAQLRAIDPDVLAAHGHQFPAIYPPTTLDTGPQE